MKAILIIAGNELSRTFKTPGAWIVLGIVELLLAILFMILLNQFLNPSPWFAGQGATKIIGSGLLQVTGIVILMITPFLTMRCFSEERRTGTIKLLQSSPLSSTELVLGKFLSLVGFQFILACLIMLMPLSLGLCTRIDLQLLAAAFLALMLLMASFSAIGMFLSSCTSQPMIAAVLTFGMLFLLWIINLATGTGSEVTHAVFSYLSLLNHYGSMVSGLVKSEDIAYYLIIIILFNVLTIWRLDTERQF